jgi:acyl-CoA thioesterase II
MGGSLMAQAIVAACKTVDSEFHIHHLTSQFLYPARGEIPLRFEVARISDAKNNVGRTVSIVQKDKVNAFIVMSFIRRPILDDQSLNYQPHFPKNIEEPLEDVDDTTFTGQEMLQTQSLGRTFGIISRSQLRNSDCAC